VSIEAQLSSIVRASHGRILGLLAAKTRDIARAEDALSHAYRSAVERWREEGVPDNPEGWLVRVAKNFMIDKARAHSEKRRASMVDANGEMIDMPAPEPDDDEKDGDPRLRLMFAAAHPALEEGIRAPLVMQTILGLEASEIADLFCVPAATMAQRLVRAKTKIRDAGIPFAIPPREDWKERLGAVLEAVYGTFTAGFEDDYATESERRQKDRGVDALFLADLLASMLPDEPEALGLASLICFSASRADARVSSERGFIPLEEQDPTRWDTRLVTHAASLLSRAARHGQYGRFQLEAAVQAVHADRARTGRIDWQAIAQLYEGLLHTAPTRGVIVARAYVVAKLAGPDAGLAALQMLPEDALTSYAPALACRGFLFGQKGASARAAAEYAKAATLTAPGPSQTHLLAQVTRFGGNG
jgi:RNA polymerase sigma-70 factor (ECF subfamily)